MKRLLSRPGARNHSGFTLVELLVVIGIIAILAGVLLSSGNLAIKMAKRAKAASMANQIQTAALAYYTEYGVYPVPPTTATDFEIKDSGAAAGASWASLDRVLCGNIYPSDGTTYTPTATDPANTRGIAFLSLKSTDVFTAADVVANANAAQDAPKNPLPTSNALNLFFNIAFDSDYSNTIGYNTGSAVVDLPNIALSTTSTMSTHGTATSGVAVWANCNGNATSTNPSWWVTAGF